MNREERNRLQWRCRRGLLELDLVLRKYLSEYPDDRRLSELLALPDNDLWDIIGGRSERYDPSLKEVVARLRAVQPGVP